MITKVTLKNWRSHLDTTLDFSDGTNCFIGNIGSGKTTVMDAICFGMFGTTLQLQQKKIKLEDMIMKKPEQKEQAEVTVDFNIEGVDWSIKRTVTKGKSTAELRKNGELIEGPQASKVTVEVEKILKMNYDLFSRAVYSEQNQLDMFLTIPKGQRMKKIDELLAIDKFERARANTKSIKNRCLSLMAEKENLVKSLETDEGMRKLESIKMDLEKSKAKADELARQLDDISRRKIVSAKDLAMLKEQQRRIQSIDKETSKYNALIELTESDLDQLKSYLAEHAEKTLEELNAESARYGGEIECLSASLIKEKESLDNFKDGYREESSRIMILEKEKIPKLEQESKEFMLIAEKLRKSTAKKISLELGEKKECLEKALMNMQNALAKIPELESSIQELSAAGGSCPVCSTKLTESKKTSLLSGNKKLLDELKKLVETSRKETSKLKDDISVLDGKLREAERMEERFEQIKDSGKQLKVLTKELDELNGKVKVFISQKMMFEKNIKLLEENLESAKKRWDSIDIVLKKKEEANAKLDRLKEYRQMLAQLSKERDMTPFSMPVLEKIEQDYQDLIGLEKELSVRVSGHSDMIKEKQKLIEEVESKRKIIESYKIEIKRLEAISEQLHMLEISLGSTQEQLRKDFVSSVNDAMQSIWPELYPYKDFNSIKLGIEEGDYVLQLQDSTGWVAADGIVSGGERSIACLALRIALSLVLAPSIDMLVLDEPTANLDARTVEVMSNVLRDKITNFVEQVFLITHDSALENAVSGYLYRLEREKERNGYTNVTMITGPHS